MSGEEGWRRYPDVCAGSVVGYDHSELQRVAGVVPEAGAQTCDDSDTAAIFAAATATSPRGQEAQGDEDRVMLSWGQC